MDSDDDTQIIEDASLVIGGCMFCQRHEDLRGAKVYEHCDSLDGRPCLACTRYIQLGARIEEEKAKFSKTLAEHNEMRRSINRAHDPILRRVPPEIASHIFKLALPDVLSKNVERSPRRRETSTPLKLGAVCKAWRELIWATPHLWTSVQANVHTSSSPFQPLDEMPAMNRLKLSIFRQWLSRTGQLPLSVHLNIDPYYEDTNRPPELDILENDYGAFFHVLNTYSSRLWHLAIECPPGLLQQFTGDSRGAPLLRRLLLVSNDSHDPDEYGRPPHVKFSIAAGLPQPTVVHLSHYWLRSVEVDWSNLTNLTAETFNTNECIEVLKQAPKLKHCNFVDVKQDPDRHSLQPPVVHTTLEYLSISIGYHRGDFMMIIDRLTLPALNKLMIRLSHDELPCGGLLSFVERSTCILRTFHVYHTKYDEEKLGMVLRALPSIEDLVLYPNEETNHEPRDFFSLLARTSTIPVGADLQQQFLPNLLSFAYMIYKRNRIPWDLIPDIFGPLSGQRRPLNIFSLAEHQGQFKHRRRRSVSKSFINDITDGAVINRLLSLHDAGITLMLPQKIGREDLLAVLLQQQVEVVELEDS